MPKDEGLRQPLAAVNVPDRKFREKRPNRTWIADFTYVCTAEDWLYFVVVIDVFFRRVVGWSAGR